MDLSPKNRFKAFHHHKIPWIARSHPYIKQVTVKRQVMVKRQCTDWTSRLPEILSRTGRVSVPVFKKGSSAAGDVKPSGGFVFDKDPVEQSERLKKLSASVKLCQKKSGGAENEQLGGKCSSLNKQNNDDIRQLLNKQTELTNKKYSAHEFLLRRKNNLETIQNLYKMHHKNRPVAAAGVDHSSQSEVPAAVPADPSAVLAVVPAAADPEAVPAAAADPEVGAAAGAPAGLSPANWACTAPGGDHPALAACWPHTRPANHTVEKVVDVGGDNHHDIFGFGKVYGQVGLTVHGPNGDSVNRRVSPNEDIVHLYGHENPSKVPRVSATPAREQIQPLDVFGFEDIYRQCKSILDQPMIEKSWPPQLVTKNSEFDDIYRDVLRKFR